MVCTRKTYGSWYKNTASSAELNSNLTVMHLAKIQQLLKIFDNVPVQYRVLYHRKNDGIQLKNSWRSLGDFN